jgi:hypothetical protein
MGGKRPGGAVTTDSSLVRWDSRRTIDASRCGSGCPAGGDDDEATATEEEADRG